MSTKVWLITGCSTGFGRHIAEAALARGDRVVATARDTEALKTLVERHPERALAQRLDVTDPASVETAVSAALAEFGRIDVVVNNAGYGLRGAVEDLPDAQLRHVFDTNVFGVVTVTKAVLPTMRAQRSGHIIQMSAVGGVVTRLGGTAYGATKFALEGLSEGLAAEVAPLGIRVTIVEPGPFRTDFAGRSIRWVEPSADYAPAMRPAQERFEAQDGKQEGDPERAARAILMLADLEKPPLRLPLGANAFDRIRARLRERLAELDEVEPLGRETDFPT